MSFVDIHVIYCTNHRLICLDLRRVPLSDECRDIATQSTVPQNRITWNVIMIALFSNQSMTGIITRLL